MTLKDWNNLIRKNGLTIKDWCIKNDIPYRSYRVLSANGYRASPQVAKQISEATNGMVSIIEILYRDDEFVNRKLTRQPKKDDPT